MRFGFLLKWYNKVLEWSRHPKAIFYLSFVGFGDASFFPVSPNFMILPMCFANPKKSFYYAAVTACFSFLGGMLGYLIGYFAYQSVVDPLLHSLGYVKQYEMVKHWFHIWGYWAILVGCFLPFFPYKFFTIGAGVLQLDFVGFLGVTLLGRTGRFLTIATIIRFGGPKVEPVLRRALMRMSSPEEKRSSTSNEH